MAKKMGTNPLSGLNGLIRSTQEAPAPPSVVTPLTQAASGAQYAPKPQYEQNAQHAPAAPITHDTQYVGSDDSALRGNDPALRGNDPALRDDVRRAGSSRHTAAPPPIADHTHDTQDALDTHTVQNAPDVRDAQPAQKTQGRKGHKLPRINMAFSSEHLAYLHAIAGFERMSATQYVNNLIKADMKRREDLYERLNAMRGEGG